jgi:hypothetical protein
MSVANPAPHHPAERIGKQRSPSRAANQLPQARDKTTRTGRRTTASRTEHRVFEERYHQGKSRSRVRFPAVSILLSPLFPRSSV